MDLKWLETCAAAGEFLYGYFSVTALKRMYEAKPGCHITHEDVIAGMQELRASGSVLTDYVKGRLDDSDDDYGFFTPSELEGTPLEKIMKEADRTGNPYASLHLDKKERSFLLDDVPDDLDYYIPEWQETEQLVQEGYIRTPEMTKLEEEIRKRKGDPSPLISLWGKVSTDKLDNMESIHAVMDLVSFSSEGSSEAGDKSYEGVLKEMNRFLSYATAFLNNVNLRARRGWRPQELFEKTRPREGFIPTVVPGSVKAAGLLKQTEDQLRALGANVDYSTIDRMPVTGRYGERRMVKVGRNDPCPCGSGLKYKRGHGRGK